MEPAGGATASTPLDPTLLTLLSIFGGALLAALFGLLGAWLQSRHDRARWLRERRLQAYSDYLAVTDEFFATGIAAEIDGAPDSQLVEEMRRTSGLVHLLGPDRIYGRAKAFQDAMKVSLQHDGAIDELESQRVSARRQFITAARKSLR